MTVAVDQHLNHHPPLLHQCHIEPLQHLRHHPPLQYECHLPPLQYQWAVIVAEDVSFVVDVDILGAVAAGVAVSVVEDVAVALAVAMSRLPIYSHHVCKTFF